MSLSKVILRRWYVALASLATITTFQAIFFPRWPKAQPLSSALLNASIQATDIQAKQLPSLPSTRTYDLASSPLLIWKLTDGQELSVVRTSSRDLTNFQVAFLARANSSLGIKNRRIQSTPIPLASGRRQGRSILQTCMLPGSDGRRGLGATAGQLRKSQAQIPSTTRDKLLKFFGLPPSSGNSCVLVTLKSTTSQTDSNLSRFQALLKSIAPVASSVETSPQSS
jgi:hypothetical protein